MIFFFCLVEAEVNNVIWKVTYKAGETDGLDVIIEIVEIVFST